MSITKRNHYSPQFANRPWANSQGRMIRIRRGLAGNHKRSTTGPKKWGQEEGLYPQDLENALGKLETKVAPLYRKLQKADCSIDLKERILWSHYLLCQYSRTPLHIIDLAKLPESVLSRFNAVDPSINSDAQLDAALEAIVDTTTSNRLLPFLATRDWLIGEAPAGLAFPRTDVPVVFTGPLVRETSQILYPLSPTHCFIGTIFGEFPPMARLASSQLTRQYVVQAVELLVRNADLELVLHPDMEEHSLVNQIPNWIGTASGYYSLGVVPDLRRE